MGVFSDASETHAADTVSLVDSALLHDAVLCCVQRGWLLSFGSSRDGGAVSLGITNDEGRDRIWCGSVAELERGLQALVAAGGSGPAAVRPNGVSVAPGATEGPIQKKAQVKPGRRGEG